MMTRQADSPAAVTAGTTPPWTTTAAARLHVHEAAFQEVQEKHVVGLQHGAEVFGAGCPQFAFAGCQVPGAALRILRKMIN